MPTAPAPAEKRRVRPAVWLASTATAATLFLGINGTLASWTQAIVTNSTNDVKSTSAVALKESNAAGTQCVDTATSADNTATCSTINKYGGTTTPLAPGGSQSVTVKLANTGAGSGTLTLEPGACTDGGTAYHLCDKAMVQVSCTSPSTLNSTAIALKSFTTQTVGTLAAGAGTDCTFTVSLPSDTPSGYANQIASQVLVWKLVSA